MDRLISFLEVAAMPLAVLYVGTIVNATLKEQEIAVEWIRTALGILREGSAKVEPLREWAVDLLDRYSPDVTLDNETKHKLIRGEITMPPAYTHRIPKGLSHTERIRRYGDLCSSIKRALLRRISALDIHDVSHVDFTDDGDASVMVTPHQPGEESEVIPLGEDRRGHVAFTVTSPYDWSREGEGAVAEEVADVLAERIRLRFDDVGHYKG